ITTYISAKCPVYFAPAMDLDMFKHPANQNNIKKLKEYGNKIIEPQEGELASGLCGAGRMEEPEVIFNILKEELKKKGPLSGKKVMVTAGPTIERIDPVRYIGNFSSGKMGFALAEAFRQFGAEVTLITGPVALPDPSPGIKRIDVESAAQMLESLEKEFEHTDLLVMSAAVADYKPAHVSKSKIKKSTDQWQLELSKNPDILAGIAKKKKPGQKIIGFALETDNALDNASAKLQKKNLDMIVLNSLKDEGAGFGTDTNKVTLITPKTKKELPLKKKMEIAQDIVNYFVANIQD
ncbi:MAG: bifunctional phosphopantothenoylcysteine decarboxylase/phosphopantothenate--cysteine ligase CoaBC, partial [Bacteroidota bacterium]